MKRHILISLFILASLGQSGLVFAAGDPDMNSGILYGDHFSYGLTAPKGWVLDNQSGGSMGLAAVFYPKDSTWDKTSVFMYANSTTKGKGDSLDSFVLNDVKNYRDNRKTAKIEDGPSLTTADGNKVPVKYFLGDMKGNYEACAYVDQKNAVAFLVLTSTNEALFRKSLPAFAGLVSSYRYLTDNVNMTDKAPVTVSYGIPTDVMAQAKKDTDSKEGQAYDGSMGSLLSGDKDFMGCVGGKTGLGTYRIVLVVDKDGKAQTIYAEKHGTAYECLAQKFKGAALPLPPRAPFYYLFELEVKK